MTTDLRPQGTQTRPRGALVPALLAGAVAGIDNVAVVLAGAALIFSGPLASGMGLGVGVMLLGGAILAAVIALRSTLPVSVALVQEATIAVLATAIAAATVQVMEPQAKVATAIALIGASSLVTGLAFWVTGRLRMGGLVRFLPFPVVAGFLAASGWLLVDGAVVVLTGHEVGPELVPALAAPEVLARVVPAAAFAAAMMVALNRRAHHSTVPILLAAAVGLYYLVLHLLGTSTDAARAMGQLNDFDAVGRVALPTPSMLGLVDWLAVASALPSLLVIAGLGMIGLMLNTGALEIALGRDIDVNAELRSSGLANLASGAVGGPSGFVGLSMTLLAVKTGAAGRATGLALAAVVLLTLAFAGPLVTLVPVYVTGGFVLFLGIELLKQWFYDTRARMPFAEWLVVAAILATVATIGFMEGLALGVLVSSALFVFKYSRLPVVRLHATGAEQRSTVDRSPAAIKFLSEHGRAIEIVHLQGYLFFGTAERLVDLVRRRVAAPGLTPLRFLVLDFRNVSGADSAAITCFTKIRRLAADAGATGYLTQVPRDLRRHLRLAGVVNGTEGPMHFEADFDHALEAAEEALLGDRPSSDSGRGLEEHFGATIGPHPRFRDLIRSMDRLDLAPEDVLIRQGEQASDVYFVASGRVRVQIILPNGKVLRVRTMLAGAVVGEIALYLGQPRTADVIVDAPSTILRLGAEDLARLERDDAELAALAHRLLACNLSEKLSVANRMIQVTMR